MKDEEEITYESRKQVAIKIMRTNLPEYVVNCFVAAGFDTLEVIADMDTSGEPGNSLQLIEDSSTMNTQAIPSLPMVPQLPVHSSFRLATVKVLQSLCSKQSCRRKK